MTELGVARVECYSGYSYAQEPRALVWEGRRYLVAEIEVRWRAPDGPAFRVRSGSGERFDLHYDELGDRWTIALLPGDPSSEHQVPTGQGGP